MSRKRLEGPTVHTIVPQERRMRHRDQQVAGDDTKTDPQGSLKRDKIVPKCQKKKAFCSSVLVHSLDQVMETVHRGGCDMSWGGVGLQDTHTPHPPTPDACSGACTPGRSRSPERSWGWGLGARLVGMNANGRTVYRQHTVCATCWISILTLRLFWRHRL